MKKNIPSLQDFKDIYQKRLSESLNDYFTFLKFQSISADPAYKDEVEKCADWIAHYLTVAGMNVEKWRAEKGHPILFATNLNAGPEKETVLLYCHYDVQPVDPLELWEKPPFEPYVEKNQVYARGASDNKGQCFYTSLALKILHELLPSFPFNLKFIIEGEEESGSSALAQLLEEKKEELKADHLLIVDSGLETPNEPVISLGARGISCMTLELTGSRSDLHSGSYGGIVYNPNRALVEMLAKLHDEKNKVAVPGFYDDVELLSPKEKVIFKLAFDEKKLQSDVGAKATGVENGFTPFESAWLRPTLEINGISGGYAGPGFKTVIPAKASAKLSCRLVPNQHPDKIADLVKNYLLQLVPKGIEAKITIHEGSGKSCRTSPNSKIAKLLSDTYSTVFQKPCQKILLGGSIPIAASLAETSEAEMVLVGTALPTNQIHAPNEHFSLESLEQGFLTICYSLSHFDSI